MQNKEKTFLNLQSFITSFENNEISPHKKRAVAQTFKFTVNRKPCNLIKYNHLIILPEMRLKNFDKTLSAFYKLIYKVPQKKPY